MDPWGPDREGKERKRTGAGMELGSGDGTGLPPQSGSSKQNGGLERPGIQGAGLKNLEPKTEERGRLALGAEAHQTTVDWETKLLGLQPPWESPKEDQIRRGQDRSE